MLLMAETWKISQETGVWRKKMCKVLLPISSLVVHKYIARLWGMLRECTLGSSRVLHFYQHKYIYITIILARVVQVDAFLLSISKLVTSVL